MNEPNEACLIILKILPHFNDGKILINNTQKSHCCKLNLMHTINDKEWRQRDIFFANED